MPTSAGRRVTIAEVARAAGVSKTTVSVVLNGGAGVLGISTATQQLVVETATRLGYTPNYAAQALRRRRTSILTLLVQDFGNPLFVDLAVAARAAAEAQGFELNVIDAGRLEVEVKALEHLRDGRADGVIVATGRHHVRQPAIAALLELVGRGTPSVMLIDRSPDPRVPAIRPDVEGGSYAAVSHLVGLGHRRIAHVTLRGAGEIDAEPSARGDRYRAYRRALDDAGIAFDASLVLRGPDTLAGGREMARALLALDPRPTAAFVYNDLTAIGVLRGLAEAGVRVPRDVAVVGFDGIELGAYTTPALTSVRIAAREMAERAVEMLFGLIGDGVPAERDTLVPAELLVRESCGASG